MNKTKSSSQGWREATPRKTFSPEVQERAVRRVEEHRQDYPFPYVSTWQGVCMWLSSSMYLPGASWAGESQPVHADGFRSGCAGTSPVCPTTGRAGTVHHSDRGSPYLSIRYTDRLTEAGIEPSVGGKGDSYDNALAETINGIYKTELIYPRGPWKTRESVEIATLQWVHWFNHQRTFLFGRKRILLLGTNKKQGVPLTGPPVLSENRDFA